jgi:hypothetical protein
MEGDVLSRETGPLTEYELRVFELALYGIRGQELVAALELDMSHEELRSWLSWAASRIEPVERPPVPNEHLEILEPLTARELMGCVREANIDRCQHIHAHHPHGEDGATVDHWVDVLLKATVGRSGEAVRVAQSGGLAGEPTNTSVAEDNDVPGVVKWCASNAVSKYWAHVREGHIPPAESEEGYLRGLVERVRRQDVPRISRMDAHAEAAIDESPRRR